MATLVGQAHPDCDWKDKNSIYGCREQAKFQIFLKDENDAAVYVDRKFFGCKSHAPEIAKGMVQIAFEFAKRDGKKLKVVVEDLDLVREREKRNAAVFRPFNGIIVKPS